MDFSALGAQIVGGVLVPINTRFKASEAAYVLNHSGAKFLLCDNKFLGQNYAQELRDSRITLPSLEHVIDFQGPRTLNAHLGKIFLRKVIQYRSRRCMNARKNHAVGFMRHHLHIWDNWQT